jgi:hypothetical protein
MRHAGHLDRITRRRTTLGQREIEQACGFFGIVEKQLIEVAHPVKHERARMLPLDAQVLLHHRGMLCDVIGRCGLNAHPECLLALAVQGVSLTRRRAD